MLATLERTQRLVEHVAAGGRVDAQAGVIRDVQILGRVSKNRRTYSEAALQQAASLTEGASVFLNHPHRREASAERDLAHKIGWLENVRVSGGAVRGDLHLLLTHPQAATVLEAAQKNPGLMGLSHCAEGSVKNSVVESVERVYSVDLVHNPATSRGLFEDAAMLPADSLGDSGPELSELETAWLDILRSDKTRAEKLRDAGIVLDAQASLDKVADEPTDEENQPAEPVAESHVPGNRRANFLDAVPRRYTGLGDMLGTSDAAKSDHASFVASLGERGGNAPTSYEILSAMGVEPSQRRRLVESEPELEFARTHEEFIRDLR